MKNGRILPRRMILYLQEPAEDDERPYISSSRKHHLSLSDEAADFIPRSSCELLFLRIVEKGSRLGRLHGTLHDWLTALPRKSERDRILKVLR